MFTLENVGLWGRPLNEYRRIFSLTDDDLNRKILGCGDGPASFNAEATRQGHRIVSCDPIYRFDRSQIQDRIAATYDEIMNQTRLNAHEFVWGQVFRDVEDLGQTRMAAMRTFLDDFESGKRAGRYVAAALPVLPFEDDAFELALCSHFLFLYSSRFDEAFHRAALHELCRVASEVRIFPLLALGSQPSPFVDRVADDLRQTGHDVMIEKVPYEFQRGGDRMMRVLTQ